SLPSLCVCRVFYKYPLVGIAEADGRAHAVFIAFAPELTTYQIGLVKLFFLPVIVDAKNIVPINDHNVCVVAGRMDKYFIFPFRVMYHKQGFIVLNTEALVEIFIQVETEKLPFLIAVEIKFAVDRMDGRPVALSVGR